MEHIEDVYQKLRKAVEKAVGREMRTPRDFDFLSAQAFYATKQYISSMTLKRFWGYLGEKHMHKPRLATLNILAQLIGYMDWMSYYKDLNEVGGSQSCFLNNRALYTSSLEHGALIEVKWNPNRRIVIRHEGYEVFTIIESANSKLSIGDTFRCGHIVEGQTMILGGLIHGGQKFSGYVCGLEKGVLYEIIDGGEAPPCNTLIHNTLQNYLFTFRGEHPESMHHSGHKF
jgi:hypothetical protein